MTTRVFTTEVESLTQDDSSFSYSSFITTSGNGLFPINLNIVKGNVVSFIMYQMGTRLHLSPIIELNIGILCEQFNL